jgi:hypothetical protein
MLAAPAWHARPPLKLCPASCSAAPARRAAAPADSRAAALSAAPSPWLAGGAAPARARPPAQQAILVRRGLMSNTPPAQVQQQQCSAWMLSSSVLAAAARGAWHACLGAAAAWRPTAAVLSRVTVQRQQPRQWVRPLTTCSSRCGRTSQAWLGGRAGPPPTRCAAATPPQPARRRLAAAAGQARHEMPLWPPAAPERHQQGPPHWSSSQAGGHAQVAPTRLAALCRPTARRGARSGSRCEGSDGPRLLWCTSFMLPHDIVTLTLNCFFL